MPKKILIVDDEPLVREYVKKILASLNLELLEAKTGQEALAVALKQHPDLILLDIIMPGMHGFEVLNYLGADSWGKHVPVIILTNFPEYPGLGDFSTKGYEILNKAEIKNDEIIARVKDKLSLK